MTSRAALLALPLLLAGCRGHRGAETAPPAPASEEGSAETATTETAPSEAAPEAGPSPLEAWTPIAPQSEAYAGPCALDSEALGAEGDVTRLRTVLLYDADGRKRVEYTVSGGDNSSASAHTYDYEGETMVFEAVSSGAMRDAMTRRLHTLNPDHSIRLRQNLSLRAGQDFRIAYRYADGVRHGDIDMHFDGFIDSTAEATLHANGEVIQEDIDNNGDGVFERRVLNTYDEAGNDVVREVYDNGAEAPSERSSRTFDAHNNLLGHVTDRGVDGTRDVVSSPSYACWQPYAPPAVCHDAAPFVEETGLRACAFDYVARRQVDAPLVMVDALYEPVRGVLTLAVNADGTYNLDDAAFADVPSLIAAALEREHALAATEAEAPLIRYRLAIAPEAPMAALVPLFGELEARRARRLLLVFDTQVAIAPDARLEGAPDGPICEAVTEALAACDDTCLDCVGAVLTAWSTCDCDSDPLAIAKALSARYAVERPQTGWSIRLDTEATEPLTVAPTDTWATVYPEVLATNPNSLWLTLRAGE